ncbi:PH and SEC7 domain-containing protein [Phanerochaete sordida]|uniref:PH and SEC7 domain-containing protein n=1 Tax=Phanerochaete sordida TaxID=48140 RepID=A0A9P3LHG4_9APHY|nr:PH and SEC7 domain-containing protein [Phanerochaete sordida]
MPHCSLLERAGPWVCLCFLIGAWQNQRRGDEATTARLRLASQRPRHSPHSLHNLASLFRQPSPRSPVPPTSFPAGLQPVGSKDVHGLASRRVSRTDLDFEQALRAEGTVVLKESLDIDTLGVLDTSNTSYASFSSPDPPPKTPSIGVQPATPTIVPPTPSPTSLAAPLPSRDSSSSYSSREVYYDAQEDTDLQTKRRSMYRSPGTASSPDLATLLRKSRNKEANAGRAGASTHSPSAYRLAPTDSKDSGSSRERQRSATAGSSSSACTSPSGTPGPKTKLRVGTGGGPSTDWVLTSPRSMASMRDSGISKSSKSSVRAKTTAFLGKMLGTSSTRERSRTVTSQSSGGSGPYTAPPVFDAFPPPVPPVPPLPQAHREPAKSFESDVFSSPSSSLDLHKPLPEISPDPNDTDSDTEIEDTVDHSMSMVVVKPRARTPSPTGTVTHDTVKASSVAPTRNKRRSMSVSDVDLKRVMSAGSTSSAMPRPSMSSHLSRDSGSSDWNSIMTDFKGELLQLDPISTALLDLKDPSTQSRKRLSVRSHSDNAIPTSSQAAADRPQPKHSSTEPNLAQPPTPTLTLQQPSLEKMNASPIRARSGSASNAGSPRVPGIRHGPRSPVRSAVTSLTYIPSPIRDENRLRVQHRSTASSSEPSLVPIRDVRDTRRNFSGLSATSQQDLAANDLLITRFSAGLSPGKGEMTGDMKARGEELAARCWSEDEEFMARDKIAEWLGGQSPINRIALRYYMDYFDFTGLRLDNAFRRLCGKLFLKAETQQVDRILEQFARRYWECNPTSIFGSASVVHAVTYSLLLLNTDLHVAELTSRMSRQQFVRNTLGTIQLQVQAGSSSDLANDDWSSVRAGSDVSDGGPPAGRTIKRSDSITSWSSVTREAFISNMGGKAASSGQLTSASTDTSGTRPQTPVNESVLSVISVRDGKSSDSGAPAIVYDRKWEGEMEDLLKEIYSSVKTSQILQPTGSIALARSSTSSLSPHGTVLRNLSMRGQQGDRFNNLKRGSIRGLQSILSPQGGYSPYAATNPTDGRASPAPSFATSHDGVHASTASFLTPTLGFASNLSHTIIREAQEDDTHSVRSDHSTTTEISISDEELALLGPPWAKEGMLCRKQYWESTGKRAKSKAWMDVFVVIQKGELSMFVFGDHSLGSANVVGGGNWLENAQPVGTVTLAHSLAHALPPPGYNRQRPHCMVLTLANGGVYFFQAGTEELVNEWVQTCNYWAARTSKEPLTGGVSNMEYGWNRVLEPDNSDAVSTKSGRSGKSKFSKKEFAATVRGDKSPWADRTFINDWKPPMPPTVPSSHDEEGQMDALQKHVAALKDDLVQHNELRGPMMNLYAPRSNNASKALGNWEKRSQWILNQIVKYESYIDSLRAAMNLRLKKRGEKALERALSGGVPEDAPAKNHAKGKWKGQPDEETIEESEEPPPSAKGESTMRSHNSHRRETADSER